MIRLARTLTISLLCCVPAWSTVRNVQTCGAAGNGSTDDTAAINACIGRLVAGDILLFPSGKYRVTSALTPIRVNNVEVNGSSGAATIKSSASGGTIFTVGGSAGTTSSQNLTATANELSQTISANFGALGAAAGSYILIEQGPSGASGQRGEVVLLTSTAGTSGTLATMVHDTFSTTTPNEVANLKLLNTPVSGLYFHDVILDGDSHRAGNAINITNLVNSTFTNVTVQNFTGLGGCAFNGAAIAACYTYGVTFNNITITGTGNGGGGGTFQSGFNSIYSGNDTFNGMSITSGNGGTVADGVFAFALAEGANTYGANITIDATTNGVGRPFKLEDCRYCSWVNLAVQNQSSAAFGDNGITLEYFTARNLFTNCAVIGIAGSTSFGINLYGDDNGQNEGNVSYNTFYNCSVRVLSPATSGFGVHTNDVNNTILGGSYSGVSGNHVIDTTIGGNTAANFYVSGATISVPGSIGIASGGTTACINNNTFNGLFSGGYAIHVSGGTATGTGNTLAENLSNLTAGSCPLTSEGSGALASLSPSNVNFGSQVLNTTSGTQTITLTNGIGSYSGTNALSFVSPPYLAVGTQFAVSAKTCSGTVAAGGSCTVTLTFTPTSTGAQSDTLTFLDNAGGAWQTVVVSGIGLAPNKRDEFSGSPGTPIR